ncbi:MAG: M1 family metallopeptidase [Oscillochloris sp.]|nr:M1 family metallopeptidase [Oscillochloris sp.]
MITRACSVLLALVLLVAGCTSVSPSAQALAASPTVASSAATSVLGQWAAEETAAPTETPVPTPNPAPPALPPEIERQTPALLPAAVGDLVGSSAWDRYTIIAALSTSDLSVRGTLTLDLVNRYDTPLNRLYFHLYPNHPDFGGRLDITSAAVDGVPVPSGTQRGDTLFYLELGTPLAQGATAHVVLGFKAKTPRSASNDTFGAYNFEAGVWSLANFYPVLARYFPGSGWDTRQIESRGDFVVSSVALYDVTLDAPTGWTLVSSGVTIGDSPVNEQVHRQRFVSGPQREFYLGALQGLSSAEKVVDGTRIVVHFQPRHAEAGQAGLAIAERSLRAFNARYGTYPLAELEVVEAALTQFLGMEYPGVVLIEQDLYAGVDRDLETTIAHEIAHQWWYSQVGNDAQGEPWLDEGMASYAQVVYYEQAGAPQQAEAELQSFRDIFRRARAGGRDAPLGASSAQLGGGRYYPVIYAKAPLFIYALRRQIGEQSFERFLHAYYSTARYKDIVGADLLRVAQESCGCDLTGLYNDWVLTTTTVAIP